MSSKQITGIAMASLVAGSILGILFAPAKGSETRRRLGARSANDNTIKPLAIQFAAIDNEERVLYVDESF